MEEEILVSVICQTYNHENYIEDALKGFVSQKTDFKYEVLINDDASTDSTPNIIKHYEEKYPDIIKPVYQKENCYSKGIRITDDILFPLAKGKYIAYCEGDDWWCDENKLQKQVDFLENHSEYSACTHSSYIFNQLDKSKVVYHPEETDCDISVADIFEWGNKRFQTSSVLCRRELVLMPKEFIISKIGDYPRAIYYAINGKVRYLHDVMSVYRVNTPGSWTSSFNNSGSEQRKQVNQGIIDMLKRIDLYTNNAYSKEIKTAIEVYEISNLLIDGDYRQIVDNYKETYIKTCSKRDYYGLWLKVKIPALWDLQHYVRHELFRKH